MGHYPLPPADDNEQLGPVAREHFHVAVSKIGLVRDYLNDMLTGRAQVSVDLVEHVAVTLMYAAYDWQRGLAQQALDRHERAA